MLFCNEYPFPLRASNSYKASKSNKVKSFTRGQQIKMQVCGFLPKLLYLVLLFHFQLIHIIMIMKDNSVVDDKKSVDIRPNN